jgi:hypothetical protein
VLFLEGTQAVPGLPVKDGVSKYVDRLCGLVVSVEDYKHRDSRALLMIFLRELGLERGPLSLVIR